MSATMKEPVRQTIHLKEYATTRLAQDVISTQVGELLWRHYSAQLDVEAPSFRTGNCWALRPRGWVGFLPAADIDFVLAPRISVDKLLGMLEYVYDLGPVRFLHGRAQANSLTGFYTQLAILLAHGVLARCRQGVHRVYEGRSARPAHFRGRLMSRDIAQRPWQATLPCRYKEQTADHLDNRILAWTLHCILRSGLCAGDALPVVRRAYRGIMRTTSLEPITAAACRDRVYSRQTADYAPMHALCYFFLEHSTPGHQSGPNRVTPFLVDMARTFERFVGAWLQAHVETSQYRLAVQARQQVARKPNLHFQADLVIYDGSGRQPRWVLDTKYKMPGDENNSADVAQVLSYAHAMGAPEAVLVYPFRPRQPLDACINGIRMRSIGFSLGGSLQENGEVFLDELMNG